MILIPFDCAREIRMLRGEADLVECQLQLETDNARRREQRDRVERLHEAIVRLQVRHGVVFSREVQ